MDLQCQKWPNYQKCYYNNSHSRLFLLQRENGWIRFNLFNCSTTVSYCIPVIWIAKHYHCDQIWQMCPFLRVYIVFCKKKLTTLAKKLLLGKFSLLEMAKYCTKILSSGHTFDESAEKSSRLEINKQQMLHPQLQRAFWLGDYVIKTLAFSYFRTEEGKAWGEAGARFWIQSETKNIIFPPRFMTQQELL